MVVTGPAGTGKTAVLVERFARLLEGGAVAERTALVVRTGRARAAVREAVLSRLGGELPGLPVLRVATVHALARQILGEGAAVSRLAEPPRVLSAQEQFDLVAELLESADPGDWPAYGGMLRSPGFADQVRQFVSRAQEALLSPDELRERAGAAGRTGFLELADFYERYLDVLDAIGAVDFPGLVRAAARVAEDRRGTDPPFDHLLVDDYQDATFATEALLAGLAGLGATSVVLAGDLGSHILSFQGTTDVPLRRAARTFVAEEVELRECHRAPGGPALGAWRAPHPADQHAAVARALRRAHVEDGVAWRDLAVIVRRQGPGLGGLLRALDDAGVPRATPERGVRLRSEPAVRPFLLALRWLADGGERDALVEPLLTSELAGLSPASARALVRAAFAGGGRGRAGASAAGVLDAADAAASLDAGERAAVGRLRDALAAAGEVAGRSALDAFRILWRDLPWSARLVEAADGSARGRRDLDAVTAFADALGEAAEAGHASAAAFLDSLAPDDEGPGVGLGVDDEQAVRVLTAHGAAGMEFDTVAVLDVAEGSFPSLERPEPMFDLGALEGPRSQAEVNRERLEDERRLFRTVLGSARRRALLFVADPQDPEDGSAEPSRFAAELGLAWEPAPAGEADPVTASEAEARWRRTLADPGTPAHERVAALEGLVALPADPVRWWFRRDWTGTADPPSGELRVSFSRLDAFENCPLEYVLGSEVGLESPSGHSAWVGTLVHGLVEDVDAGILPRDLEAVRAEADARWERDRFPSLAVSEAYRRQVRERMLPNWFAEYGGVPALAREQAFAFDFDGATVNGFIDRIGPAGDGCQITDYKTGRGSYDRAEDSLQLGIYYLGVERSSELRARFGPVRAVELVFLRERRSTRPFRLRFAIHEAEAGAYRAAVEGRLRGLLERLRAARAAGSFPPSPEADCTWCSFRMLCPLWPEGADPFPAAPPGRVPAAERVG